MRLTNPVMAYRYMAPIDDAHVPPVLNQWYTALTATNIRILQLFMAQGNTETDNKNIEWEITIDGEVYTSVVDAVHANEYYFFEDYSGIPPPTTGTIGQMGITYSEAGNGAGVIGFICARSFSIRYRLTSAAGTDQTLTMAIVYEKLASIA